MRTLTELLDACRCAGALAAPDGDPHWVLDPTTCPVHAGMRPRKDHPVTHPDPDSTPVARLRHHPVLDVYLTDRGWDRADTGIWRWTPSLADTPETTWDVTTVMFTDHGILAALVGERLGEVIDYPTVAAVAEVVEALEAARWVP